MPKDGRYHQTMYIGFYRQHGEKLCKAVDEVGRSLINRNKTPLILVSSVSTFMLTFSLLFCWAMRGTSVLTWWDMSPHICLDYPIDIVWNMYDERVIDAQTRYKNRWWGPLIQMNGGVVGCKNNVTFNFELVLWHKLLYFRSSIDIVCLSVGKYLTMELKYHSLHV